MKPLGGLFLALCILVFAGCGERTFRLPSGKLVVGDSLVDSLRLCRAIDLMCDSDRDTTLADDAVRAFYRRLHSLCWITNDGLTDQADSLISYVEKSGETGMPNSLFYLEELKADRERLDSLDFSDCDMHTLISRLDYRLTKAFVRYSAWQRYGLVNPYHVLNRLDHPKYDTLKISYLTLYDIPTETIDGRGLMHLADLAGTDSVAAILADAEPHMLLYRLLKAKLQKSSGSERRRILVNMERCRWRHPSVPGDDEKYVVVNIPSYSLTGVCQDSVIRMRIVCGSQETKTPLLHGQIKRMDVNPRWNVPYDVVKHEMSGHAGDSSYFARNRYHIVSNKSGVPQNPRLVTASMLRSGHYRVYQEGGKGNSLGRIIFRFDNQHSIYLHDTSSPGAFDREDRRISHGCIRVQHPFKLADFLMGDMKGERDEWLDKLRYSMEYEKSLEAPARRVKHSEDGNKHASEPEGPDPEKLVHSLKVSPTIPVYITYFTLFHLPDSILHTHPDVYGYDEILAPLVCF